MRDDDLPRFDDLLAGEQIAGTRAYQEDDFRIVGFPDGDPDGCDLLLVLADGMGGHWGGAQASRLAVSTFGDTFGQTTGGHRSAPASVARCGQRSRWPVRGGACAIRRHGVHAGGMRRDQRRGGTLDQRR